MSTHNTAIGFIGQGWIGKHYADDFEARGYTTVRYALEEPYVQNKAAVGECEIVFIAVPTPTTPEGFSCTAVREALTLLRPGTTAVIKSTIVPGTTTQLQLEFPELFVFHSPEFLREASAVDDAANPERNIVGIPQDNDEYRAKAQQVLDVLPKAPYAAIIPALEAELVKYVGNCFLYAKVVMMNIFHDTVVGTGANWDTVREAVIHDPRIGASHTQPVHASGRGAGGHCFIKDFEAFRGFAANYAPDAAMATLLADMVSCNNQLLTKSGKDLDLLKGVYGDTLTPQPK